MEFHYVAGKATGSLAMPRKWHVHCGSCGSLWYCGQLLLVGQRKGVWSMKETTAAVPKGSTIYSGDLANRLHE